MVGSGHPCHVKLSASQLKPALRKDLLPCYLVTGDEPLLVQRALDEIRAAARRQGFGARELYVAAGGFDWREVAEASASLSLFAEKRIVEIRLPTGKPGRDGSAAIVDIVEAAGEDLLVLVEAPKLDRSTLAGRWVRALDKAGAVLQIWPVGPRELPRWIGGAMRDAGLQPDGEAVRLLAERVEGNLLAADQEIQKLALLLGEGPVTAADIVNAVADSSRYDMFKLVDAAVAGHGARALRMLGRLRAEGIEAVPIVWVLTRELRMLAGLAERVQAGTELGAAMQREKVWSSRQGIVRACLSGHAAADFYRLLQAVQRADAAAKGQLALDPWQLITDVVLGLSSARRRAA